MARPERLESSRDELQAKLEEGQLAEVEFERVKEVLDQFPSLWEEATLEERKELMRLLIEKMEASPTEAALKLRFNEETEIPIKHGRWG